MSISWGALAGAFLAPFLYGLYSKKVTKPAVWASFFTGIGVVLIHMVLFSLGWFPELVAKVASWLENKHSFTYKCWCFRNGVRTDTVPIVSALLRFLIRNTLKYSYVIQNKTH